MRVQCELSYCAECEIQEGVGSVSEEAVRMYIERRKTRGVTIFEANIRG